MARLAGLAVVGLPDDLGRQLLAVWLDTCFTVVRQRGWHEPLLYMPRRMCGAVLARETAASDYQVVSALGAAVFSAGRAVTSAAVLRAARPLEERKRTPRH
jgi:hypothetical protein